MTTAQAAPEVATDAAPEAALDAVLAVIANLEVGVRAAQAEQLRQVARAHELMAVIESHPSRTRRDDDECIRRSMVSELATTLRVHERTASRMLSDAAYLTDGFGATHSALASGVIGVPQMRELLDAAHTLPEAARAEFETLALEKAARMTPPAFRQAARRLRERMHPRRLEERHEAARAERRLFLDPEADGMAWLHFLLEAGRATAIVAHVELLASRVGTDDPRTRRQREIDCAASLLLGSSSTATAEAADGNAAADASGSCADLGVVRPVVYVTVPALTLLGCSDEPAELDGYGPIDPQTARELAAHAPSFQRILTHPETGAFLSYGRTSYRVPADLAAYLRVRDGACRFPGCSRRAAGGDIDHTTDWRRGGETTHTNLAHLCRKHHRLKHLTRWRVEFGPRGELRWASPAGRAYVNEPERFAPSSSDSSDSSPPKSAAA